MTWTKREIITASFEEIGLASYVYDLQPEQLQSALRRMDMMLATWNNKGVRIGYPIPSAAGGSDLDDDANLPDSATQAVILGLAIQIAPSFGKTIAIDTMRGFKDAYRGLLIQSAHPIEMQNPSTLPSGAGNKPWQGYDREYMPKPVDRLQAGDDSLLEFS